MSDTNNNVQEHVNSQLQRSQVPKQISELPEVFGPKDLAPPLQVNIKTLYQMVDDGSIPHVRAGRKILFYRDSVVEWLRGKVA